MTITVNLKMQHEFTVKASAKVVFDLLADVPASAKFFPNVDKLVELKKKRLVLTIISLYWVVIH